MSSLDDRMTFDMMKYRVESAPYITIARIMTALGCGDSNLKVLLKKAYGIEVVPGDNPMIYYIVTEETMKQIAQDFALSKSKNESAAEKQLLGLKVGSSPWMSLDAQQCKEDFEARIRNYNANA